MKACTLFAIPVVACVLLSLFFLDRPDFLMGSDFLMAAEFFWDLLHHGYALSGFQQSRVPSFIPDFLLFGVVQVATGSWRLAMAIWIFAVIGWLVAVGSWITARIARSAGETATLSFVLLLMAVLTAAWLGLLPPFRPYLYILMPVFHGGPFLVALTAAGVAGRAAEQAAVSGKVTFSTIALALLCWAAMISDQLSFFSLLVPLTAALLAGWFVDAIARRTAVRLLSAGWAGGVMGWACSHVFDRLPLPWPTRYAVEMSILRFTSDLWHHPSMLLLEAGLALALAGVAWGRGLRGWLGNFWAVFAATSALASLPVTILLFVDISEYRYALPLLWWPVIFAAATLARTSRRHLALLRLPVATFAAGFALAYLTTGLHVPLVFDWTTPLASCLERAGLRAGLAEYFVARRTSAASDWELQVEQITPAGAAWRMINDRFWFTHDIHDGSRRPPYRFIIMDDLPAPQITATYGPADHVMMCGSTPIWVYDDSKRLYQNLERASPSLADTFASAPAD